MFNKADKIGHYTLLEHLGSGGAGEVWLAEKQTWVTAIKVALKLPKQSAANIDAIRREVQVWESVKGHPNILALLDADIYTEAGQDIVCIVSEYAPDGSLQDWLDHNNGQAPTQEAAIKMTDGILYGLDYMHTRPDPIIHRDLKPANILLQGTTPRLADFGLARVLTASQSNEIAGTLPYMSPEVFDGDRAVAGDIWAVGIMLYQMLAGHLPYKQQTHLELVAAFARQDLPLEMPHYVPSGLHNIVMQALALDPAQRFASAQEMRTALNREWEELRRRAALETVRLVEEQRQAQEQQRLQEVARQQSEATRLKTETEEAEKQRRAEAARVQVRNEEQQRQEEKMRPVIVPQPPAPPAPHLSLAQRLRQPRYWGAAGLLLALAIAGAWVLSRQPAATPAQPANIPLPTPEATSSSNPVTPTPASPTPLATPKPPAIPSPRKPKPAPTARPAPKPRPSPSGDTNCIYTNTCQ